ncbi:winged helix-turn-helix transcriptional regulator [Morganella morganii]|uniref:winged helix-turn-helix transcriptional regulator n=1 Tax=Morganella morganii TaxID=582 RepID=UPI00129A04EF|nr:helix-turn-helix domain-containing protein [Morganella morganii]MBC3995115.1 helix-turn-helix transcriptional regulator [Morganella morganii]MBT0419909.1 helix-turn-helix transcriptional regulator [Morganella morganii subsp. morganii]MBT0514585.1 helix-turn-helix transcriptional regulator [Morganella morganii subsp. morganii]MRE58449.1 transcriptional regulator [Morganella morganii]QWM02718.1 helix-turn-helix transcriptional regulator [Morganella morganii subsp. morganii]
MSADKSGHKTPCPVARSADLIGDRWSLLIVRDAFDGIRRFGDFQRNSGIARNILSDRLRKLLSAGILEMKDASDGTAYQEYVLTEEGKHLFPVIVALRQWGEMHLFGQDEPHSLLVEKETGKPLAAMVPVSQEGRILAPDETEVKKVSL